MMIGVGALITKPLLIGAAGLVVALSAALAVQTYRVSSLKSEVAEVRQDFAEYRARAVKVAFDVQQARSAEGAERETAKQEAIDAAIAKTRDAEADARTAVATGSQLRDALAAARARRCEVNADPSPRAASSSAGAPVDMLAVVQLRLDEAAETIAVFADRSSIAGGACRAQYEALKTKE